MVDNLINVSLDELFKIVVLSDMSENKIFDKKTVKGVIDTLKSGFAVKPNQQIYVTVYRAVKESEELYSRWEIQNLVKKNYIKSNDQGEVYLPDILFYTYLRKTQQALIASGILKEPKKDLKNYDTLTEQQSEQLFIIFSKFVQRLEPEKRKEILELPEPA